MNIRDLLARRTDLSTFLVHLTRTHNGVSGQERLRTILGQRQLTAGEPRGQAVRKLSEAGLPADSQRCVCFTETPLEHVSLLIGDIDNRAYQFEPYGIAITKVQGRRRGVNPVWYVDITPGHSWLTTPLNRLVDDAISDGNFEDSQIASIAPFVEQMGTGDTYRKEFWWEREWRHRGTVDLPHRFIVLAPESEHDEFTEPSQGCPLVDPRWSLEQVIARLANFTVDDVVLL